MSGSHMPSLSVGDVQICVEGINGSALLLAFMRIGSIRRISDVKLRKRRIVQSPLDLYRHAVKFSKLLVALILQFPGSRYERLFSLVRTNRLNTLGARTPTEVDEQFCCGLESHAGVN